MAISFLWVSVNLCRKMLTVFVDVSFSLKCRDYPGEEAVCVTKLSFLKLASDWLHLNVSLTLNIFIYFDWPKVLKCGAASVANCKSIGFFCPCSWNKNNRKQKETEIAIIIFYADFIVVIGRCKAIASRVVEFYLLHLLNWRHMQWPVIAVEIEL